jgi:signal transduction histidine kinase
MASIRSRLTLAYAVALVATLVAFAIALWVGRRASLYRELEQDVVVSIDRAGRLLQQALAAGEALTTRSDTLAPGGSGPKVIAPRLRASLEGIPNYLVIADPDGRLLYGSFALRQLSDSAQLLFQQEALRLQLGGPATFYRTLDGDQLLVAARRAPPGATEIERIVAGVSTLPASLAPRELLATMLAITPLLILLSVGGAYLIAGLPFRPVEHMINEVEAITDGRSLHRRLGSSASDDELARLTRTLNAMMSRLEASFGALRRFTADASHELKTPLAVLRADVERSMHVAPGSTEQLVALEEALAETARMAELVDQLLTLARGDEGRFDIHREPVHLEPLVREVFETATILGESAGLTVLLTVAEDATVMGDHGRLRQLFLNLVTNAIKYTPRGGTVEVSLSRRIGAVTLSVRDTGIGISAADLPHIFDRFWRADRVRSRLSERGGFGLGLAISQWIAQAHGGTLTVQSRLGRGSIFTFSLPLADEPAEAPPGEPGATPVASTG